jgi:hypothetical protein
VLASMFCSLLRTYLNTCIFMPLLLDELARHSIRLLLPFAWVASEADSSHTVTMTRMHHNGLLSETL